MKKKKIKKNVMENVSFQKSVIIIKTTGQDIWVTSVTNCRFYLKTFPMQAHLNYSLALVIVQGNLE